MKQRKMSVVMIIILCITVACSGCGRGNPGTRGKELSISELCEEYADVFGKTPVSLTYTISDEEPDTCSYQVTEEEAIRQIKELILSTRVLREGTHVDMYIFKYEEFTFDFGDEIYSFGFIPDSYFCYDGMDYEIVQGNMGKIQSIIAEYGIKIHDSNVSEEGEAIKPVSAWYSEEAELETEFYDNGDEARSYIEIVISCSEGTAGGYIEGAYDIISTERRSDCYILTYTYGDFYGHDEIRQCRITAEKAEKDGELTIVELDTVDTNL